MNSDNSPQPRFQAEGRVRLVPLSRHVDDRGGLLPLEFRELPFVPTRAFTVSDAPAGVVRGGHGHRVGQQLLVCLQGRIVVTLAAGGERTAVTLSPGGPGLLIGAGIWAEQRYEAQGSVLLVLCSHPYDADSYLRDEDAAL